MSKRRSKPFLFARPIDLPRLIDSIANFIKSLSILLAILLVDGHRLQSAVDLLVERLLK
jgi:hypothetical protein